MRLALAALTLVIASGPTWAGVWSLTCTNPFRSYKLTFDQQKRKLSANDTEYQVKSVESGPGRLVVSGETGNGGPNFRAEFAPRREIVFGGDQVDHCR